MNTDQPVTDRILPFTSNYRTPALGIAPAYVVTIDGRDTGYWPPAPPQRHVFLNRAEANAFASEHDRFALELSPEESARIRQARRK